MSERVSHTEQALAQLMGYAFESVVADVERARRLLIEAGPNLTASFGALQQSLSAQGEELAAVSRELRGYGEKPGFLAEMRQVLDAFVNDLVNVSHSSMRLVSQVDTLGQGIDEIVGHVTHIETLAKATRLVALNARIEAHRAGEAGKTFRVVADEVKSLADDAAQFSKQIHEVVERTHAGLEESKSAVSQLASHDLNHILQVQQNVMATIQSLDQMNTRMTESLDRFHADINAAIRALQFEDILNQLLASVAERLGGLNELFTQWLATRSTETTSGWEELGELMKRLEPTITRKSAVQQQSLATGTAELF